MATLDNHYLSLIEMAKRTAPDGSVAQIVDVLSNIKQTFAYLPWQESNMELAHRYTQVVSEPNGAWTGMNEFTPISRGTTEEKMEQLAILKDFSDIDRELLEIQGNPEAFRNAEDKLHVRGLGKQFMEAFFYGNQGTNAGQFNGMHVRYPKLAPGSVWNGGGSSNVTSIWVVQFGEDAVSMLYPKGRGQGPGGANDFGISSEDLGLRTIDGTAANGKPGVKEVFRTRFRIASGLMIKDTRCVKRVANIPTGALKTVIGGSEIDNMLIEAINELPEMDSAYIILNRKMKTALDIYAKDKQNVNWHHESYAGKRVLMFQDSPIIMEDSIINNEPVLV
jgi:hypothetical protein